MSGKVSHSLKELGIAFVPFPDLPEVDLSDLAGIGAQVEKIREGAVRVQTWVEAAVSQLRQADGMSREARELVAAGIEATEISLVEVLRHEIPAYRRAAWAALLNQDAKRLREKLSAKATVTAEEFFLKRQAGVCMVEFQGDWETPSGEVIQDLFFLVERREEEREEGEWTLHVVEVPDHLSEFFAPCVRETFPEQGPRFESVGQPLQAVLRAVFGQTAKSAAKTARINGSK